MREIKFRVFDKNIPANGSDNELENPSGAMVDNWDYIINSAYLVDGLKGKYPIMQYTGRKDKNGKEIYEGDVLRHPHTGEHWICEFKTGCFWVTLPNERYSINIGLADGFSVVGNIYENPELLN
jgi:uncharacterized phage protein (TIGR01671 family)